MLKVYILAAKFKVWSFKLVTKSKFMASQHDHNTTGEKGKEGMHYCLCPSVLICKAHSS